MADTPVVSDAHHKMVSSFVELETATEYLRTVFEVVPLGIAIALDPECHDIRANTALAEQLGVSADDNISKTRSDGYEPQYRVFSHGVEVLGDELPLQKAMTTRRRVDGEYLIRRGDGSEIVVAASAVPLFDASGALRGGVYASLDVTAQRRAEAAERDQREQLATVLDRTADGVVIYGPDLRLRYANRAAREAAQRSLDDLLGRHLSEVMGEGHEAFSSECRAVIDTARERHFESYSAHFQAWFNVSAYPHEGGVALFFRDVTGEHDALEALRQSEEKARALAADISAVMDAVPALTFITHDPGARWMSTSRHGAQLLRIPYGGNASLSGGDTAPRFRAWRDGQELSSQQLPVQEAATTGREIRDSRLTLRFDDGATVHIFGNAVPLLDDEGKPRGAVGAFLDVTELENARKAADAANVAKDAFLSSLSHELRTPLTVILGWAQAISMLRDREELEQAGLAIEQAAKAQARLVEDLMDVARISAGKMKLEREEVPLDEIARTAVEMLRPQAEAKGVRLSVRSEPVAVLADRGRMQQVIWNLLANSLKFTPAGGSINVSSGPMNGNAEIVVADTGEGIDPRFLPSIFDAFAQERESRQYGGLGLGLAIVKHIVEAHGGRIAAQSEGRGKGATFTVRLPALS